MKAFMLDHEQDIILIVDDTASYRKILVQILGGSACRLLEAKDGETALTMVRQYLPTLVLLDVKMPGIDGFQTCKQIKGNPETADIPVVFMTSLTDMEHKLEGLKVGGVDYITKPFQAEEVLYRIQIHLKLRRISEAIILQNQQLQIEVEARVEAEQELLKLNQSLEAMVANRTKDLSSALVKLKEKEKELAYKAYYDELTSLPNRYWFMHFLNRFLDQKRKESGTLTHQHSVLFIDLDRFKVVNDSLGHLVGDELLKLVANRLHSCLPKHSSIARLGGDEFVILVTQFQDEQAVITLAETIILELQFPFKFLHYEVFIGASVGIVFSSPEHQTAMQILRDADVALYQAKAAGRGGYVILNEDLRNQALERLSLENDLRKALMEEQLVLYYQPIMDLRTHRVAGFEALIRWHHPTKGFILPSAFIQIAEETGLINYLNEYVLFKACHQIKAWQESLGTLAGIFVNINLSIANLCQSKITENIDYFLNQALFPKSCLKIEITETGLSQSSRDVLEVLHTINQLGVHLCIDDFGTGHSSLNRLHSMPIQTLKIDKSFVDRIHLDLDGYTIVKTILTLAQNLNIESVAEGIETEEQIAVLKALGCDFGQGYFFHKPLNVECATDLIQDVINQGVCR
jgi:diguanylate cyclase (GGDEF)-like protein